MITTASLTMSAGIKVSIGWVPKNKQNKVSVFCFLFTFIPGVQPARASAEILGCLLGSLSLVALELHYLSSSPTRLPEDLLRPSGSHLPGESANIPQRKGCLPVCASLFFRVLIPQVLATLPSDNICNMLPSFSSYFQQRRWYQVSLLYLETEILEMSKKIEYRDLLSGGLDDRLM